MNIVLIGMKHSGKTTLGRRLADLWSCPFHDVDAMIEEMYACETGDTLSLREIFTRHGDDYFHKIESLVISDLYMRLGDQATSCVIALGGRTALNDSACHLFREIGKVVCLRVDPDEVFARIVKNGLPPFLDRNDPHSHFHRLYAEREPEYDRHADLVVDLGRLNVDEAFERLVEALENEKCVCEPPSALPDN